MPSHPFPPPRPHTDSIADAFKRVAGTNIKSEKKGALSYEFRPIALEVESKEEEKEIVYAYID